MGRDPPSASARQVLCRCTPLPQLYSWRPSRASLNPQHLLAVSPALQILSKNLFLCIRCDLKVTQLQMFICLSKQQQKQITSRRDAGSVGPQNGIIRDIFCICLTASVLPHCVFVCGFSQLQPRCLGRD